MKGDGLAIQVLPLALILGFHSYCLFYISRTATLVLVRGTRVESFFGATQTVRGLCNRAVFHQREPKRRNSVRGAIEFTLLTARKKK